MMGDAEAKHFMMTDTFNVSDKNGVVFKWLSLVNTCKNANFFFLTSQFSRQAVVKCHGVYRLQTLPCAWQNTSRKCWMTGFKRCCFTRRQWLQAPTCHLFNSFSVYEALQHSSHLLARQGCGLLQQLEQRLGVERRR